MNVIPWASILNFVFQLVLILIEKQKNKNELRAAFLKFVAQVNPETPVWIHQRYKEDLKKLKEKYGENNAK